jgi:integrase
MLKRTPKDKLTIYRRHASGCPIKIASKLDGCECPIWVHGRLRGVRRRESLDTRSLATAIVRRDARLAGPPSPDPTPGAGIHVAGSKGANTTLAEASQEFFDSKARKSSRTVGAYECVIGHFCHWAEAKGLVYLKDIDTPHIHSYFRTFSNGVKPWSSATCNSYLTYLRVFFRFCQRRRWIAFLPTADPDLNFEHASRRTPFTPAQIILIIAAIDLLPAEDQARARALILLMLYSGMRISDATFLERESIHPKTNVLDFWVIKTRHQIKRPFVLHKQAVKALAALPKSRVYFFQPDQDGDYRKQRDALRTRQDFAESFGGFTPNYFSRVQSESDLVLKVLKLAGISGGCHRFRDTFAINMLIATDDIYAVSQCLGHSSVEITADHYLNLVPGYRDRLSDCTRGLAYQLA